MKNRNLIYILILVLSLLVPTGIFAQDIVNNPALVINALNKNQTPDKAKPIINKLTPDQRNDTRIQMALASNYFGLENYKEATNLFLKINKENNKLANYELAQCYSKLNNPALAVQYLKVHLESRNRKMQNEIKSDKAFYNIDASDEWIALWETDWYSKYDLMLEDAWADYDAGNYESVLSQMDHLNSVRKSMVDAYYLKSKAYLKVHEPNNALIAINTAIDKRSNRAEFYAQKAKAEIALNKGKKALKSVAQALLLDSTNIDFYFVRAEAYLSAENIEKAVTELNALMSLVSDFDTYKLAGEILIKAGEYQDAIKAYNHCVKLQEYNPDIYIERGDLYVKMYGYEFAEKDYTFALDFKPFDGELYYKRGVARKEQKKYDLACQDFNRAFKYKYMEADDMIRRYCQGK